MGGADITGCVKDSDCYGAYWSEGVSDDMKASTCCKMQTIRAIDEANAGYKLRVTADKAIVKSASASGPVTTNKVGYKYSACKAGKGNDKTDGYVKEAKDALAAKYITAEGLTDPSVIKLTTDGQVPGLLYFSPT